MNFHGQQECVYGFPSLPLATRASADVSEWFLEKNGEAKCISVIVVPYFDSKCKRGGKNHKRAKTILSTCPIQLIKLKPYTIFCFDFQSCMNTRLYKLDCKCMTARLGK